MTCVSYYKTIHKYKIDQSWGDLIYLQYNRPTLNLLFILQRVQANTNKLSHVEIEYMPVYNYGLPRSNNIAFGKQQNWPNGVQKQPEVYLTIVSVTILYPGFRTHKVFIR